MKRILAYTLLVLLFSTSSLLLWSQNITEQEAKVQVQQLKAKGDWEKAITLLKPFYDKSPFDIHLYQEMLDLYKGAKLYEEAHELIAYMKKIRRQDMSIVVDEALLLFHQEEGKRAQVLLDSILQHIPKNKTGIDQIAHKLEQEDKYVEAKKVYLKGREVLNTEWLYASELAYASLQLGQLDEASNYVLDMMLVPRNTMENVQEAMVRVIDFSDKGHQVLSKQIKQRIKKEPMNYRWNELWNWFLLTQGNGEEAVKETILLDKNLEEKGRRVIPMARYFEANKDYKYALQLWDYILSMGAENDFYVHANEGKMRSLLMQYEYEFPKNSISAKDLEKQFVQYFEEFPMMIETELYRQFIAFKVHYMKEIDWGVEQSKNLANKLQGTSNKDLYLKTKLDYGDYLIYQTKVWDAALVFGQIEKEDPQGAFGEWSKFKRAALAFYRGDFEWAKQILDILKVGTTEYIANDALALSVLISENTHDEFGMNALKQLAQLQLKSKQFHYEDALSQIEKMKENADYNGIKDYYLWEAFLVYKNLGDWTAAITVLEEIYKEHESSVLADDALFNMAQIYEEKLQDYSAAYQYYEALVLNFPSSTYVITSRKALQLIKRTHKNL